MKRRLTTLLLAGTLALSLSACSGGKPAPAPEPSPSAAPTPSAAQALAAPSPTPETAPTPVPTPTPLPEPSEKPGDADWHGVEDAGSFGMPSGSGCPLVVAEARADGDGLTVALLPAGSEAAFDAFRAADERVPHTEITYDADAGALLLRLEDTALSSGEVTGDDWVFDFIREHNMSYPVSTPAGAIPGGGNGFFEKAAISSDGVDTVISLLPTGGPEYRVETGDLDGDGLHPYFRLVFRAPD